MPAKFEFIVRRKGDQMVSVVEGTPPGPTQSGAVAGEGPGLSLLVSGL